MNRPGLFIVLEGPEGSGKSTLARALADRMREGLDPAAPFLQKPFTPAELVEAVQRLLATRG